MMGHTIYFAVLLSFQIVTSSPAKTNARPVIEVINEQARIDDKARPQGLTYVNPLAGNSKQNAKLHAQNQQAMFNAERVRQHRAQLQRWTKAPQQEDSYMKAYHESQENHQLALEQQQAKTKDNKAVTPAPKVRQATHIRRIKQKVTVGDTTKITKDNAVVKTERLRGREQFGTGVRNHRSYGSVEYYQHLQPKRYQTVYVSPGPTYDQGVTIKPNGNVGLTTSKQQKEETRLYTEAIPSNTQYVYPKQYSQMQNYQSAYDIDTLNSLLKKNPREQLSELNALLGKGGEQTKDPLTAPIDLYFYLKDNPSNMLPETYDQSDYAQLAHHYASAYAHESKDHTPITEEVDDIEDPNKHRPKPYTPQAAAVTLAPEEISDPTTTKNNNYYKVEVASQIISAPYNPKASYYYKEEEKPSYQSLNYQPYHTIGNDHKLEGDHSERYLHHNSHPVGIQHLSEDGTGVSAYGDDNLHYAANYEFGYRVRDYHSGNDFGHHEAKDGEKTNGHYHVLLPDGRMQKVKYSAGPEGFHADISYDHLQ